MDKQNSMNGEKIVISLTSYGKRLNNLPNVLDTIYAQTMFPDEVVLNLAYEEILPEEVNVYLKNHGVIINRVPDTKVYKKIIPTFKLFPNDCVVCIDDDWLYPNGMIADFMHIHSIYPDNPISGNKYIYRGMQCHCGCASLVKASFFGNYLDLVDDNVMKSCHSSDILYSYFAAKAAHPYIRTKGLYFLNMTPFNESVSYTKSGGNGAIKTYEFLTEHFGPIFGNINVYQKIKKDEYIEDIINDIENSLIHDVNFYYEKYTNALRSNSYRLGNFILSPFISLKRLIKKSK